MDKRKTTNLLRGEKVSSAYFHEQSRLRKRLDEYQKEESKCLRKISISQEALSGAFTTQASKTQSAETFQPETFLGRRSSAFSKLDQPGYAQNMEICHTQLRKLSIGSDTRQRKLSNCNQRKSTRKLSAPIGFSSATSLDGWGTAFPRRKFTTGQIDVAAPSKAICSNSCCTDILKSNLTKNQSTPRKCDDVLSSNVTSQQVGMFCNTSLSQLKSGHSKINFPALLPSSPNTQSRMFNETSAEEQCKYMKDSLKNTSKNLPYPRQKTSDDAVPNFQGLPSVSNEKTEAPNKTTQNIIHKIAPGSPTNTKGQFEDTELKAEEVEESATRNESPDSIYRNSNKKDPDNSNKSVFRKLSLSTDESKRRLHEQNNATLPAGALEGVRYRGNAWGERKTARRKISTVEAPQGIVISEESSPSSERRQNFEALRNFRRLALAAVAAERFNSKNFNSSSEDREGIVSKRKFSKARLEELQRPTESYLRQIVAEQTTSKTPAPKFRSKSANELTFGKSSARAVSKFRRLSHAAMATRILIDRENRKLMGSGSSTESRQEANQGKTLAEMMDELKDCRYLRSSAIKDE